MRLEWITTLREHVTELTAEATRINREYNILGKDKLEQDVRKSLVLLDHRIRLLLNPDEKTHQELLKSVHEIGEALLIKGLDDFRQLLEIVFERAQIVLRAEWQRVKKLQ